MCSLLGVRAYGSVWRPRSLGPGAITISRKMARYASSAVESGSGAHGLGLAWECLGWLALIALARCSAERVTPMSEQEERERFMLLVERDLDRVRGYLHIIVILLIYGGLIIIGLLFAITLKLFLG